MIACEHVWTVEGRRKPPPRATWSDAERLAFARHHIAPPPSWPVAPLHCSECGVVWPGERLPAAVAA